MRLITASEEIAPIIDRGAEVDGKVKRFTAEDKVTKATLVKALSGEIKNGETSVRVEGGDSVAVISATEKATIKTGAEKFDELRNSVQKGLLSIVVMKQQLTVPPDDVKRAAEILRVAGIKATISEGFTVKAADVRKMRKSESESVEQTGARVSLEACLDIDTAYRVKYESHK